MFFRVWRPGFDFVARGWVDWILSEGEMFQGCIPGAGAVLEPFQVLGGIPRAFDAYLEPQFVPRKMCTVVPVFLWGHGHVPFSKVPEVGSSHLTLHLTYIPGGISGIPDVGRDVYRENDLGIYQSKHVIGCTVGVV